MSKIVFCCKLKQEAEGLNKAPFPGSLGEKIFNGVSKQAWDMWLSHQTMLINEYRLNLMEAKSREFLKEEMEKYFFGEGSEIPEGYSEPE
jgi:Fe-S cluster biosynthesis and repair protein YggX